MAKPALIIVDDERDMAEFVADVADEIGFETRIYGSATGFMSDIAEVTPAGIVMDVVMPDMDGIELVRWLGKQGCAAPIVVMSGYGYNAFVDKIGVKSGATILGSLSKPFTVAELSHYLEQIYEASR